MMQKHISILLGFILLLSCSTTTKLIEEEKIKILKVGLAIRLCR